MAKLKKRTTEKKTCKVVSGKVVKLKNLPEVRKLEEQLNSSVRPQPQQENLESITFATPFSGKSKLLEFTSTPMSVLTNKQKWKNLSLKKVPSNLQLSPILSNISNTQQERDNGAQKKNEKSAKAPLASKTNSKRENIENVEPGIRIGNRRKSFGVRRIAPASENANIMIAKSENQKSVLNRLYARLGKETSEAALGSDSQSCTKAIKKVPLCDEANNEKIEPRSRPCRVLLRNSDFSQESLSFHSQSSQMSKENVIVPNHSQEQGNREFNELRSRRLRVRLQRNNLQSLSSQVNETSRKHISTDSSLSPYIEADDQQKTSLAKGENAQHRYKQKKSSVHLKRSTGHSNTTFSRDMNSSQDKSSNDNTLVNRLRSDWSNITVEETPAPNHSSKNNPIMKRLGNKRRLTPLIELSIEDTSIATTPETPKAAISSNNNNNEEEYSSSAEFQSDDEGNNQNRPKRAPTWNDLLNKSKSSADVEQSKSGAEPKRRRRLTYKVNQDPILNVEKEIEKPKLSSSDGNFQAENSKQSEKQNIMDGKLEGEIVNGVKERSGVNRTCEIQDSNKSPIRDNNEIEKQNQVAIPDISASEQINSTSRQPNDSDKPGSDIYTNSFHRCDDSSASNDIIDLRCPVKFFQSRLENSTATITDKHTNEKRRRSSRRKKQESIYEFLSQSSSESKNNQVDDVIKKMIETGKAVVAKHRKGTGKNVVPRKRKRKAKPKVPEKTLQPIKHLVAKSPVPKKIQDNDDDLHFDDDFHFHDGDNEIPQEQEQEEENVRDQRGFSNLARSAMIKQAGRIQKPLQRKPITDKKKLLAMAIKFVSQSTPIRPSLQPFNVTQCSPISGNKSPWRVDDDKLPNLFYLGRNSDNLPSFSSDYIPMTPIKNKSKSLSSFSSNDSNGENKTPPGAKTVTNEASMKALTNSRRALIHRSPLKSINIIEVVNLPPLALHSYGNNSNAKIAVEKNLKKTSNSVTQKSPPNQASSDNSDLSNQNTENQFETPQGQNRSKSLINDSNKNAPDLFGFEELIDNSNDSTSMTIDKTILPNKEALKERLQRLKQLRPNKPGVISTNKAKCVQPVFDNVGPKQKTLKQMFCSTMIDKQNNYGERNQTFDQTEDLSNLFKDPEPETTFDDSHPRRTYNRPFKRKRKMLSAHAIILESDGSEDEEYIERPVKNYKAKPKKRQKTNPELNKFVNEFNEMCKEVSQYELVVE